MSGISEPLAQAFSGQATACRHFGSPFSAAVLEIMLADAQAGGVFAELMAPFERLDLTQHMQAATPLRPLGWAHWLALGGEAPALTALYPPNAATADADALAALLPGLARTRFAEAAAFLTSPPQTNEVRRTLSLLGGFTTLAAETGLPLRCFEIGASAGLNLNWGWFRYQLGEVGVWGDAASPVLIAGDWTGPAPPLGPVTVVSAKGCDILPMDVREDAAARRLRAYVWADQSDRIARLTAAIGLARQTGLDLVQADAGDWVEQHIAPQPGCVTVLCHSVMWQYLPAAIQDRIRAHMQAVGAAATASAPVAWLTMEPAADFQPKMNLTLQVWPNGRQRRLALVHPHGAAVDWAPDA